MSRNNKTWRIRSVQLDLARQMETVEYIKEFMDFISANGYNSLTLYLQARIRTSSFPFPSEEESYSPEQIRQIVDFASTKELDVIPVVSTLGHVEDFLCYKELESLGELRGGRRGRFGTSLQTFCPSLAETYQFLEAYLTEVAELFPSKYFHAGCDESWDVGYCPLCRDRIEEGGESQSSIYADHLRRSHEIITGKLGKRMIIWDDMFEVYSEALDDIPKDIVMCSWHYNTVDDIPTGHFLSQKKEDSFSIYDAKGFEYMIAPADAGSAHNIETFTRYASKFQPIGGLLTSWGETSRFIFESYPLIAFAGRLWASGHVDRAEDLLTESVKTVLGVNDEAFVEAIKHLQRLPSLTERGWSFRELSRGPLTDLERERNSLAHTLSSIIHCHAGAVTNKLGKRVIEDILVQLDRAQVIRELRSAVPEFVTPCRVGPNEDACNRLKKTLADLADIHQRRLEQWEQYRNGFSPQALNSLYTNMLKGYNSLLTEDRNESLLSVIFFLPDQYSAQSTAFSIRWSGENRMELVASGTYKEPSLSSPFYQYDIPIRGKGIPEAIRIETWGYGGQGFAFLELKTTDGNYAPGGILTLEGNIDDPEHLLENDKKWCFAGERNVHRTFLNPGLANTRHIIELSMSPQ